jgi:hypothetical protein
VEIREVGVRDAPVVASLLDELGYPATPASVVARLRARDAPAGALQRLVAALHPSGRLPAEAETLAFAQERRRAGASAASPDARL